MVVFVIRRAVMLAVTLLAVVFAVPAGVLNPAIFLTALSVTMTGQGLGPTKPRRTRQEAATSAETPENVPAAGMTTEEGNAQ